MFLLFSSVFCAPSSCRLLSHAQPRKNWPIPTHLYFGTAGLFEGNPSFPSPPFSFSASPRLCASHPKPWSASRVLGGTRTTLRPSLGSPSAPQSYCQAQAAWTTRPTSLLHPQPRQASVTGSTAHLAQTASGCVGHWLSRAGNGCRFQLSLLRQARGRGAAAARARCRAAHWSVCQATQSPTAQVPPCILLCTGCGHSQRPRPACCQALIPPPKPACPDPADSGG